MTLRLYASDPSPASGVASMRFRDGSTGIWSAWSGYSTSKSWTLKAGAGTKTVYVQYWDRARNTSAAVSYTIKFARSTDTGAGTPEVFQPLFLIGNAGVSWMHRNHGLTDRYR